MLQSAIQATLNPKTMEIQYVDCLNGIMLTDANKNIVSHNFGNLPFRIQKITLKHEGMNSQFIVSNAKERLTTMRLNSINSAGVVRNEREKKLKALCGLIIEQVCFSLLTKYNTSPAVTVLLDESNSPIDQIDIRINKTWLNKERQPQLATKSIEIRSSFPFRPIAASIAEDFDILGAYTNNTKISEIAKDYYLRFLFKLDYPVDRLIKYQKNGREYINYSKTTTNVLNLDYFDENLNLKKDMVIYFVGGATRDMMQDNSLSYEGNMKSGSFNENGEGQFRKLKLRNALDCVAITRLMLSVIKDECVNSK